MRKLGFALMLALALAACSPSAEKSASESAPTHSASVLPNLFQTAYRAEAQTIDENGDTTPVVMIRDGHKLRLEMNGDEQVVIVNPDANETIVISNQAGRRMAMRMTDFEVPDVAEMWSGENIGQSATRTGSCNVAGQSGDEWSYTPENATLPNVACVTSDGIILRGVEAGRTTWETTSVQRGPQDAALFAAPPGVRVMDMSGMGPMLEDAMAKAKAAQQGR